MLPADNQASDTSDSVGSYSLEEHGDSLNVVSLAEMRMVRFGVKTLLQYNPLGLMIHLIPYSLTRLPPHQVALVLLLGLAILYSPFLHLLAPAL